MQVKAAEGCNSVPQLQCISDNPVSISMVEKI